MSKEEQMRLEVGQALRDSSHAYLTLQGEVIPAITTELDSAQLAMRIVSCVKRICATKGELFFIKKHRSIADKTRDDRYKGMKIKKSRAEEKSYIGSTKLGDEFIELISGDVLQITQNYSEHEFDPILELFIKQYKMRDLGYFRMLRATCSDVELTAWFDALKATINDIRKEVNSARFKKRCNNHQRGANKNYGELIKYIDRQFEWNARILALRVDLGYRKEFCGAFLDNDLLKYDDVKKHNKEFLAYLHKSFPKDVLLGFAYKLEYGQQKAYHYHFLLLLNGAKVREDVTIAKMIGDHWSETITEGKGLYYNCNALKAAYKQCGIGMIDQSNIQAREGLAKAALYMTKPDYFIKLALPDKGRIFGKGNMPEPRRVIKGRPRKSTQLI